MIIDAVLNRNNKDVKVIDINNPSGKIASENDEQPEENIKRSLAKTISWRVVGTLDTLIISWFIVEEVSVAAAIAGVELVTKMVLYFYHERAWNKIKWGK